MAKNIFILQFSLCPNKLSIRSIAKQFYSLCLQLGKIDKRFYDLRVCVSLRSGKTESLNLLQYNESEAIDKIANSYLRSELSDIKHFDKELSPTVDFERDFGFRFVMRFGVEPNDLQISTRFGGIGHTSIDITINNESKYEQDFEWYYSILKTVTAFFPTKWACVRISMISFVEEFAKYNYPLGWITYFSNDIEISIPDDINEIECEFIKNGKYLILTRNDFTVSKEIFVKEKEKLFATMIQLGEKVSGYKKL